MWLVQPERWLAPAAIWIALGLVATIAFERWALETGRWQYGRDMPAMFGIGLLPLLQWLVVPAVTLFAVRRVTRRHGAVT
jgi:hypothetical protein